MAWTQGKSIREPYDTQELADSDGRLARRLGVTVPAWRALADAIFHDLDDVAFGVGWWAPHPGTKRRILISDHLWACAHSVQRNLVEAAVHAAAASDAWCDESDRIAGFISRGPNGLPQAQMPPVRVPGDELPGILDDLHVAGFFRAVGSALDCLGATIIGVLGLPTPLLRSDLVSARRALQKVRDAGPGGVFQRRFDARLQSLIEAAGPPQWLRWTTDYRNMLVHRGRRLTTNGFAPRVPILLGPDGQPIPRVSTYPMLAVDPDRSDVEVFFHRDRRIMLTERGGDTIRGVLGSVTRLAEEVGHDLVAAWSTRRSDPKLISQPDEQWPSLSAPRDDFPGYAPGTVSADFDGIVSHGAVARRLKAASLFDHEQARWNEFD